jgi:bifunctional UDP-N-acetylglucosamine pyrophosphorylase/glucosamine-1-phosphate N-acetyltransferase
MGSLVGVVLAAGKGTRMKSRLPKAAHPLCGKPLARYAADLCRSVGAERVLMVVGHGADAVCNAVGDDVEYVTQEPQLGTGHAVQQTAPLLRDFPGAVLIVNGDVPLLTSETLKALLDRHHETGAAATLLSAVLDDPASYGRIVRRSDGGVERIVERKDATPEIAAVREVNAGVYCFAGPDLFNTVFRLDPNNEQGELYLTDVIGTLVAEGKRVEACVTDDPHVMLGVNDRVELAQAAAILRARINRRWMLEGVTMVDPASTYIDADVEIGPDTVILPMTLLEGGTRVGAGCRLGPSTTIRECTLGDGVTVQYSLVVEAEIADETAIGPFAQLRPGCTLGKGVKVGNFVELKKSAIGDHAKVSHLSYIGDADVGERANIGAGTITCNYDGRKKHRTTIGAGAFVGSHSTLIAPVEIGENAYIAAASPINQDVPPDALAIARSRQTNKDGWARRKRE